MPRTALWLVLTLLCAGTAVTGQEAFVWFEAEKPASANFEFKPIEHPLLSGGQCVQQTAAAKEGAKKTTPLAQPLELAYPARITGAGEYELWLRVGYDFARSPLLWQIDDGAWRTFAADAPTTSLACLYDWNEVTWGLAGRATLTAGEHTVRIRCSETAADGRLLFSLDCLALVPPGWTPEGKLKPGEQYLDAIDQQAGERLFQMPVQQIAFTPGTFGRPMARPSGDGGRIALELRGLWEAARYDDPCMAKDTFEPVRQLPAPGAYELRWRGVQVPGQITRTDMAYAHRILYRTRVHVPQELTGRSLVLRLEATGWIVSLFVNGQFVASQKTENLPWEADVTSAIELGSVNTITLAVKDGYYALDHQTFRRQPKPSLHHLRALPPGMHKDRLYLAPVPASDPYGFSTLFPGISGPVILEARGAVYATDAFVRTSVSAMRLDATVNVNNPAAAPADVTLRCQALLAADGRVAKDFNPVKVRVPAKSNQDVEISGAFPEAKLWWPAESLTDKPECYLLRTIVERDGRAIDVRNDLFGFREIALRGKDLLLNGIPWHFYRWHDLPNANTAEEWLRRYHEQEWRATRLARPLFGSLPAAFTVFDEHGIPVRPGNGLDGCLANFELHKDIIWQNFTDHVRQFIKAHRNHPSIITWNLSNEMLVVNARLVYAATYLEMEDRLLAIADLAAKLDPTRPTSDDGGGDCRGKMPINNLHYCWPHGKDFPGLNYDLPAAPTGESAEIYRKRLTAGYYYWDRQRPLWMGEEFFYSGNLSTMAWIGGPDVYRGRSFADQAAGRYAAMGVQASRWQGVTGFDVFTHELPEARVSFQPRAVFVREWNSAFFAGATMSRTIKVFNDGRSKDPLTLDWRLWLGDRQTAAGSQTYAVPPGEAMQDTLQIKLPEADGRRDGRLELTLAAGGQVVFRDQKPVCLLPRTSVWPGTAPKTLAVFDPQGTAVKWLEDHKGARKWTTDADFFTTVKAPREILPEARVLLIGGQAITAENKADWAQAIRDFLAKGCTAIVLEQAMPLAGDDLPIAGIEVASETAGKPAMLEFVKAGGCTGQIAFPMSPAHPVFRDLTPREFFTWGADERVFAVSYATPGTGVIPLIQAGADIGLMPMMDVPVGCGRLLLNQLHVASRLQTEPVADRLLFNMLAWAAERTTAKPGRTVTCLADDSTLAKFLSETALSHTTVATPGEALSSGADVLVLKATAQAVGSLLREKDKVLSHCRAGRWIMLCNLDADGLAAFNQLVGFEHRLRTFRREATKLLERQDPILMGVSDREIAMLDDDMLAPWKGIYWTSRRVFTSVVDGTEVASFAADDQMKGASLTVLTDGLTDLDFWKYIQYVELAAPPLTFRFDRPETFRGLRLWSTAIYLPLKDIEVSFDDGEPLKLTLQKSDEAQDFTFEPRQSRTVSIQVKSHYPGEAQQKLVQVDDVQLFRSLPPDFSQRVVMLTQPGGLVKYPIGAGGIVLNQFDSSEAAKAIPPAKNEVQAAANRNKKLAITANLLRNMGASFAMKPGLQGGGQSQEVAK